MLAALISHLRNQWMGALALFLVLTSGVAYAANTVFTGDIVDDQVYSADVRNDSLRGGGLAASDLRAGSVRSSEVLNDTAAGGGLTAFDLRSSSVGGSEIATDGVHPEDVRDDTLEGGGLGAADLAPGSVGGSEVADDSLGGADIHESSLSQVPSARIGGLGRWFGNRSCDPGGVQVYVDCGYLTLALPSRSRVLMIGAANARRLSGSVAVGFCRLVTNLGAVAGSEIFVNAPDGIGLTAITEPVGPGPVDFGVECRQDVNDVDYLHVQLSAVAISPD